MNGQTVSLFSQFNRTNLRKVQWMFNGKYISPDSNRRLTGATVDQPELTISGIQECDAGTYKCTLSYTDEVLPRIYNVVVKVLAGKSIRCQLIHITSFYVFSLPSF